MTTPTPTATTSLNSETRFRVRILLTEKEKEIIRLIAYEHSDKDIGKKLFLSHHTIHTYRKNLMSKLNVTKSTGLVRRGFELGILTSSPIFTS